MSYSHWQEAFQLLLLFPFPFADQFFAHKNQSLGAYWKLCVGYLNIDICFCFMKNVYTQNQSFKAIYLANVIIFSFSETVCKFLIGCN